MSDGRKRILSLSTGRTKRKVWNKTRGKYMPVQIIQNLTEMDRALHYNKKEWLEKFLDGKGTSDNGKDSADNNNDVRIIMKIMAFAGGFCNICNKIASPNLLQDLIYSFVVYKLCSRTLLLV